MKREQTITPADVGRRVIDVRGIDWDWRTPCEDTVVRAVEQLGCVCHVVIASKEMGFALYFDPADIRLLPLETQK